MHLICYICDSNVPMEQEHHVIRSIIQTAKRENPKRNITGVLFYTDQKFLQILEGTESDLRDLMQSIEKDTRHKNVEYLVDRPVTKKGFQTWNMDVFHLDGSYTFDAQTLKKLTESFAQNLVPRSDTLALYYKALLSQKTF